MIGITVAIAVGLVILTVVIVLVRRIVSEPGPQRSEHIYFDVGPPKSTDDTPAPKTDDRP